MKTLVNLIRQWFITAACFLLMWSGVVCVSAEASGTCGDGVSWSFNDGMLLVTGSGAMSDYAENDWAPWFDVRNDIVSIVIEDGVTSIGNVAFYDCSKLQSVMLSDTVVSIGAHAFQDCKSLVSIEMSSSVRVIHDSAFKGCSSLKGIYLPSSLEMIGNGAFYLCESLVSVRIPSSVYYLGNSAFSYCTSLVQAEINASVSEIPSWTFYHCTSLVDVVLNSAIDSVGDSSFTGCDQLSSVSSNAISDLTSSIESQSGTSVEIKENAGTNHLHTNIETETESKEIVENDGFMSESVIDRTDKTEVYVDALIKDNSGWDAFVDEVLKQDDNNQGLGVDKPLDVDVHVQTGSTLPKDVINSFTGKDIELNIQNSQGSFTIHCAALEDVRYDLDLTYELIKLIEADESISDLLQGSDGYSLRFKGNLDIQITVKLYVGHAGENASLYQKDGKDWKLIQTVHIDSLGYASFYLDGYDSLTEYLIGINTSSNNILLSEEEYDSYGGLMDEYGNKYEITGVESKWGITLGQFTLMVAAVMIFLVAMIGVVMYVLFKRNQMLENKKRYSSNKEEKRKS